MVERPQWASVQILASPPSVGVPWQVALSLWASLSSPVGKPWSPGEEPVTYCALKGGRKSKARRGKGILGKARGPLPQGVPPTRGLPAALRMACTWVRTWRELGAGSAGGRRLRALSDAGRLLPAQVQPAGATLGAREGLGGPGGRNPLLSPARSSVVPAPPSGNTAPASSPRLAGPLLQACARASAPSPALLPLPAQLGLSAIPGPP